MFALLAELSPAQNQSPVALDTNETLFTVLTAINTCGYDQDLGVSDPLRSRVRSQVAQARQASQAAEDATQAMCQYYQEHQQPEASKALAQYVSLALYLNPPPALTAKVKDADMPPDAALVLGILPLLPKFSETVGLHAIWEADREAYGALTGRYHEALAKILFDTEIYLKLPSSSRLGRDFTVYVDPMGAPGQTNARNYGSDYYVVISPGPSAGLKMEQIRHTYLHYLLDPMAMKYPANMKRLAPLLETVKAAPMDQSFKSDASLLLTECLIRAIEARTAGSKKAPEAERLQAVQNSAKQGFILTTYFYEALLRFEKDPASLSNAYGDLVSGIDVGKERRRATQVTFASTSDTELLHLSRPQQSKLLSPPSRSFRQAIPRARKNWRNRRSTKRTKTRAGRFSFWRKSPLTTRTCRGHETILNALWKWRMNRRCWPGPIFIWEEFSICRKTERRRSTNTGRL